MSIICNSCKIDFKQNVINMLVNTIEKKDTYTSGHSNRVAEYSVLIAKMANVNEEDLKKLSQAALMHDIGKVLIPIHILQKKEKLTINEYTHMKSHAKFGWEMIKEIKLFNEHAFIIKHHHEWYNGNGYPDGLKKNKIPLLSRIICIADAFDAMISCRPYKDSLTVTEALNELKRYSGTQFDPNIVPKAIKAFKKYFQHTQKTTLNTINYTFQENSY